MVPPFQVRSAATRRLLFGLRLLPLIWFNYGYQCLPLDELHGLHGVERGAAPLKFIQGPPRPLGHLEEEAQVPVLQDFDAAASLSSLPMPLRLSASLASRSTAFASKP